VSTFTPDAAAALPGPGWLRSRRAVSAESFAAASLPTTDEEVWRYSRVDDLDLDRYAPAPAPPSTTVPEAFGDLLGAIGDPAALLVARNGRVVHVEVREGLAAKGLRVGAASADDEGALGTVLTEAPDAFATLNDAFAPEPVVVRVPAGLAVDGPVVVAHWTEGEGVAAFPRLVVLAGADSEVNVLEVQGSDDAAGLVVPVTEIAAAQAARVGHATVQRLGLATWQLGLQTSSLEAQSTLRSTSVGFGGDYARLRTDCRMVGAGSTGELDAVYFGEADQTLDFRTFQNHVAPDCTSNLLFKGAVGGRSRSVYTGMIRVGKAARGTNAFQTNRNVKLSDEAWAESVPNLVIENNDVRCSHASAVGPIDEEQQYYLESRGLDPEVTRRLIVMGFFEAVLRRVPDPSLEAGVRLAVVDKFVRAVAGRRG
jgi:Fe-S cluster assembly protein SufD